ncbi:MAG: hypothetical protein NT150_15775 [Bacteroidetes bacterium]|nr:hypothetical protein [Bacteroidota bacterium]
MMEKVLQYLPHFIVGLGVWTALNGVLHEIFVLLSDHAKQYDRNLLRLLVDGLILMFAGTIMIFLFSGLKNGARIFFIIGLICSITMVIYCALIWPFLPAFIIAILHLISIFLLSYSLITKS